MKTLRNFFSVASVRLAAFLLVLACASTSSANAQGLASIVGAVHDQSGAVVAQAQVVATQTTTGTHTEVTTNAEGNYVFPALAPSTYSISVTSPGFASFTTTNVALQADQTVNIPVALQVGGATESIVISAQAPQVDISTGTLSQVVDDRQINELPLNGRNAASLTTLIAGVTTAPNAGSDQGNTKTFPVVVNVAVNGTRANQTNYLLDGGNNVDEYTNVNGPFPFPDALQEFSVQTSNFAAEYGQSAGGVVNIITRSGTNLYHGNLFEYVRNAVFNAHNHFGFITNSAGALVPYVDPLKRNQFGGTFGGPVAIPHVWKLQNGFFFGGYQHSAYRTQTTTIASSSLPSTLNEAGQFNFTAATPAAAATGCIRDPFTTGNPCFPYANVAGTTTYTSTISPTRFDPASLKLLNYIPVASSSINFAYQKPTSQNYDEAVGRFDQDLGSHDHLVARYFLDIFHNNGVLNLSNLLTYADFSDITYQSALVSDAHTFSSRLVNNLIVSYQREGAQRGPQPGSIDVGDLGVNIFQPAIKAIQSISVSGNFSFGDNPTGTFKRSNVTLADDLHLVRGQHSLGFGFHGEVSKIDVVNQNGQPGTFSFTSTTTNNALASFFLGYVYEFKQTSGQYQQNRAKYTGVYAQDNWKASRRLTLDYGLRWEPYIPLHDIANRVGQFNPAAYAAGLKSVVYPNAPAGLLFVGDPGVPVDGIRPTYRNFMPRLGFAYDVFGDGKTSLRGGGGLFFDTRSNGLFNNAWIGSTPFSTSVDLIQQPGGTFSNPYGTLADPFPAPVPPAKNTPFILPFAVITFDPSGNFQVPLTYSYNLTTEQQIASSLSLRIAYVGVHASHVFTSPELNPAVYCGGGAATCTASTNARRLYQNYTTISETNMGGNSSYNSLQVTVRQRMKYGLVGAINYTWSKSMDNIPNGAAVSSAGAGQSYVLPLYLPNYKRLDIGPSDFDHRNIVSVNYVWLFPEFKGGYRPLRAVVNGWETTGIVSFNSGDALSLMAGKDVSLTGINRDVPLQAGAPYGGNACGTVTLCSNWLNPTSFAFAAPGQFGNVKKGSFLGPQYINWNGGLARNFKIYERMSLQFRAEYFNLLNHTNLSDPTVSLSSSSFGRITAANDPRIADLALKLSF